jgi:hypothetical protein
MSELGLTWPLNGARTPRNAVFDQQPPWRLDVRLSQGQPSRNSGLRENFLYRNASLYFMTNLQTIWPPIARTDGRAWTPHKAFLLCCCIVNLFELQIISIKNQCTIHTALSKMYFTVVSCKYKAFLLSLSRLKGVGKVVLTATWFWHLCKQHNRVHQTKVKQITLAGWMLDGSLLQNISF